MTNIINENIFTKRYPHLDIHGESSAIAEVIIGEFINDNIKLKNEFVVIVHGKGEGILKKKTHEVLAKNSKIIDYKLDIYNMGTTIVHLRIDN